MGESTSIYQDIATRTGGDIYIGVVGPVRTGKSTFIKRFMETMVLPQMEDGAEKERATDEMPQSGSGKNVMTTEPKFVPDKAVTIQMGENFSFQVKLIDCVGFPVKGAGGLEEDGVSRMVNTPWSEDPLPFEKAAEFGTKKVINEHSTVAVVITTDGSIGDIAREHYVKAEEDVMEEMKRSGKPFVVILNSTHPEDLETKNLAHHLSEKYAVPVLPKNCFSLEEGDMIHIIRNMLLEFPLKEVWVEIPHWIFAEESDRMLRQDINELLNDSFGKIRKTGEIYSAINSLEECCHIESAQITTSDLGSGVIEIKLTLGHQVFMSTLSQATGKNITDEEDLIKQFCFLSQMEEKFKQWEKALAEVESCGYGIVTPNIEDLQLEEPEIVKHPGGYGVKLKASAPSIHLIKANIQAEISPIVGSQSQSEDMVKFLLKEFEEDPAKIWQSNMFGKSLYELVNEGLNAKLNHMPQAAREKLGETLQKIINEGSGGLICIIL